MKKLAALSLAIALILSLAGCAAQAKTFDIGKASKLVITSGSNGESVEVTDAKCIKQITDNFNALKFKDEGKINCALTQLRIHLLRLPGIEAAGKTGKLPLPDSAVQILLRTSIGSPA